MKAKLDALKNRLGEIYDLSMVNSLLSWDQTTYMPPGGARARGRQMALLSGLAHQRLTDAEVGRLLDALDPWAAKEPHDSDDAALVRVARREFDRAVKVPADLVSEMNQHFSNTYQAWLAARPANDFAGMVPRLQKTLDLSRRHAECFPGYEHIADPLIDASDYGMKASTVKAVFGELRSRVVPLVREITSRPTPDNSFLSQGASAEQQLAFGRDVIRTFGYDFERGREDLTTHPFMTKFSLGDVRITTHVRENMCNALFSTLHEAGHAMYEQGIRMDLEGTPLAHGTSSGVHESQSRLWENLVGRSRGFWNHFFPKYQAAFPTQLGKLPLDTFFRAINRVDRGLIRIDADEVTYNLHVMIRFDFELALLEGKLAVKDLAQAWRERYLADLGVSSPDDRDGVLQDVHWYAGPIGGAFQGYTLGNILGAQFFETAVRAHPAIPDEIGRGKFATLHGWLRENIYQHGSKFTANELIERTTGSKMSIEPYMKYLTGKFGALYGLEASVRA
jgi:carboxypeptidase Taq